MWIARLSDGTYVTEGVAPWEVRPGERLPWARLCEHLEQNNLSISQLNFTNGNTITFPVAQQRFGYTSHKPDSFSIQNTLEVDNILGGAYSSEFLDIACHFPTFVLHYVVDIGSGNVQILVSEPTTPIASAPCD